MTMVGKKSQYKSKPSGNTRLLSYLLVATIFTYLENSRMNHPSVQVCTQELPLPDGVDVIHAAPAGGHLSSASIYPACFAPYIIVTACSDSTIR